jgi:hypothetical protein
MKKLLLLAAAVAVAWYYSQQPVGIHQPSGEPAVVQERGSDAIAEAFANQRNGAQVTGEGRVSRILGDDSLGDRHQRFILELPSGQTLLVAHNIDLAPRVESLAVGDAVEFHGEYEWNDKGGTVHWTHHDPQGSHEGGWLKHRGRVYE